MTHHELKQTALKRPEVKAAYEALGPEFELLHQMVKARQEAGLTQAQVAERMGTKPPAVARLEASLSSGKHSPSIATLRKYAEAVACRLEIYLVRDQATPNPYEAPGCQEAKRSPSPDSARCFLLAQPASGIAT
jgi:transcriptional regulator with XRE-family HTH domain